MTQSPADKHPPKAKAPDEWGSREIAEYIAAQRKADAARELTRMEFEMGCG